MKKSEHTPGPWHIGNEQNYSVDRYAKRAEWSRIRSANGGLIAKIESVHPKGKRQSVDFDIEAANARLIAAAPDLLLCCRVLLSYFDEGEIEITWADGTPGNLDAMREAVKKTSTI